ncbi:O-antigen ligase family protein [Candidatus Roizmanbacteria bacterium]|nr:O-antigen ligase family protein [Candidatus Roizmanbacteria bacterium]
MAVKGRLLINVFLAGLFFSSFIFLPKTALIYEIPRVWFISIWIEVLIVLSLIFGWPHLRKRNVDGLLIFAVILYGLIAAASVFSGVDPKKSFFGNYWRADGVVTFLHLFGLFFFLTLFWDRRWEEKLAAAIGVAAFSNAAFAIGNGIVTQTYPLIGTFGHPNFLAGYLVVSLPFIFFSFEKARSQDERAAWFVCALIVLLTIAVTGSVGGILGIAVLCLTVILNKENVSRFRIIASLAVLAVIAGTVFLVVQKQTGFLPEGRERIFVRGVLAFSKKPVLGWGWANFDYAFKSVDWPMKYEFDKYVDKAHSSVLEALVTTGILGFLAYLFIIGYALLRFVKDKRLPFYLFAAFLLFLIHSQTNVISISEELMFWLLLGIIAARKA